MIAITPYQLRPPSLARPHLWTQRRTDLVGRNILLVGLQGGEEISARWLASRLSRTVGACSSPAPPISCNDSRSHGAS